MVLIGKVAIVTGAADGIGLACARRFARDGAKVVLADVDEEKGAAAEEEITAKGGAAKFVHCDVGERLDIHNLVAATLDAYDRIDVLVNNASVSTSTPFLEITDSAFDRVMGVNVRGPFLAAQAVARQMIGQMAKEGPGGRNTPRPYSIINMSSIEAIVATEDHLVDSVSKGAVNQLTRALSVALAPHGIRVNAIGPGSIMLHSPDHPPDRTRAETLARTPLGRFGGPEEIAAIAMFLASDDASYITGQCIYADGGRLALNYTVPGAKT